MSSSVIESQQALVTLQPAAVAHPLTGITSPYSQPPGTLLVSPCGPGATVQDGNQQRSVFSVEDAGQGMQEQQQQQQQYHCQQMLSPEDFKACSRWLIELDMHGADEAVRCMAERKDPAWAVYSTLGSVCSHTIPNSGGGSGLSAGVLAVDLFGEGSQIHPHSAWWCRLFAALSMSFKEL